MKSLKSFALGFVMALVLCATSLTHADSIYKAIDVVLNSINISIGNEQVAKIGDTYTLDDGNEVPFSINYKGTTYLPIRKVSELLNKDVIWDQETKTAKIIDKVQTQVPQKDEHNSNELEKLNDDKDKPQVVDVEAKSGTEVEIVFSEEVDKTTAEDISNYAVIEKYSNKELEIKRAELDNTNKKVILTMYGQKGVTLYSAQISNVTDLAGNAIDNTTKVFVGLESGEELSDEVEISDGQFDVVRVKTLSSDKIEIQFNKYLDEKTAEKFSNYTIKEKNGNGNNLEVYNADIDKTGTRVIISTAKQKGATLYSIEMKNVKDIEGDSINNTQTFIGIGDTQPSFSVNSVKYISNNQVEIIFNEKAEEGTVGNITNYTINEKYGVKSSISVINASYSSDDRKVILTTSTMQENMLYEIKLENIHSAYGWLLKTTTYTFLKQ